MQVKQIWNHPSTLDGIIQVRFLSWKSPNCKGKYGHTHFIGEWFLDCLPWARSLQSTFTITSLQCLFCSIGQKSSPALYTDRRTKWHSAKLTSINKDTILDIVRQQESGTRLYSLSFCHGAWHTISFQYLWKTWDQTANPVSWPDVWCFSQKSLVGLRNKKLTWRRENSRVC